jgi:hypothetical protein
MKRQITLFLFLFFTCLYDVQAASSEDRYINAVWECNLYKMTPIVINGTIIDIPTCTRATIQGTSSKNCFPGYAQVKRWSFQKQDYEPISMSQLMVGDVIMTYDPVQKKLVNDTIYAFLDQQRMVQQYEDKNNGQNDNGYDTCMTMIRITFSPEPFSHGSDNWVSPYQFVDVTPNHMIHRLWYHHFENIPDKSALDFVPASMIHRDDRILYNNRYVSVQHVTTFCFVSDYYSPLTISGTLMVDGVWFSNYVQMSGPYRIMYTHQVAHQFMAPLRMYYQFYNLLYQNQNKNQNQRATQIQGLHPYVSFMQTFYEHLASFLH